MSPAGISSLNIPLDFGRELSVTGDAPERKKSVFKSLLPVEFKSFYLKAKEKYNQLPSFSFPSVREGIGRIVSVVGEGIKFQDVSLSEARDLGNPTNIPSSATLRKQLSTSLFQMLISGETQTAYVNYKILIRQLDEYRQLPKKNQREIKKALSKLDFLEVKASTLQRESKDKIEAVNDLLKSIEKERRTLSLKAEIMEQIPEDYEGSQISLFKSNVAQGALSEVSFVTYENGKKGFFKPVTEDLSSLGATEGGKAGIPNEKSSLEAHLAQRNVLSCEVSNLLPGNLVPETVFASHNGVVGTFQQQAPGSSLFQEERKPIPADSRHIKKLCQHQTGDDNDRNCLKSSYKSLEISVSNESLLTVRDNLVYRGDALLEEAEFSDLLKTGEIKATAEFLSSVDTTIDFSHSSLQKAMSQAHIFDLLTGQVDRNPGNFFYEKLKNEDGSESGSYRLHLIDNDQSFGCKYANFTEETMSRFYQGCTIQKLPRLVDSEMANAILNLKEEDLRALSIKMGQTEEEILATLGRLRGLKEHIQNISDGKVKGGSIVTTWNEETYKELKEEKDNYTFRTLEDVKGLKLQLETIKSSLDPASEQSSIF